MPVHERLAEQAAHAPDRTALVSGEERFTYGEVQRAVLGMAAALRTVGVVPGDRVMVLVPNSLPTVVSFFAAWNLGAIAVVIDPAAPADRLVYLLRDAQPRALIAASAAAGRVRAAVGELPDALAPAVIWVGEATELCSADLEFHTAVQTPPPELVAVDPDRPASIIYASGSTGRPEGVTLSHRSIDVVVRSVSGYLQHTDRDVVLCLLQLAFGYGLLQVLVPFSTGGTVVLERGFGFPNDVVRRIEQERITGLAGVPTLWAMLLQLGDLDQRDLSSVRYLTNAAAAMPQRFIEPVRHVFPRAQLFLMHGQTECLRTTFLPPSELDVRPASVGRGMPGVELWLEDDAGHRLPPGSEGELVVRGENVMLGYWNDAVATARVVRPGRAPTERVLKTGDLFRTDQDGWFSFVARRDDIIKFRGEKVSPLEIEELLYARPEVFEARVIGVPDDVSGHIVHAEVVLQPGAEITEVQLRRFLRERLEPHKVPASISFVTSLPKTAGGKITRTP